MRYVKTLDKQFWANDGSAALSGLSNGSVVWLTPTEGQSGVVHTTGVAGDFLKVPLLGDVDRLICCYRSKILTLGGLLNVTGANVTPIICAQADSFGLTVTAAVIAAGGTGYAVNDTVTLPTGMGTAQAVLTVATITGGGGTGPIGTVTITRPGQYRSPVSTAMQSPVTPSATSGSGTGATFTVTMGEDADFSQPPTSLVDPSLATASSGGGRYGSDLLAAIFWEGGTVQPAAAVSDLPATSNGGLFGEASPNAALDRFGWTFEVVPRVNSSVSGQVATIRHPLSGIQDLYLAIGVFQSLSGTLTTTKLKGAIRLFGYREVDAD